jgi:glycosyltransferase involved in cell wall biosynthesis
MTRLSVCIPFFGKPAEFLQAAVDSASSQLPPGSELLLFPDGPHAQAIVAKISSPQGTKVLTSGGQLGLAGNWNRCILESTGDLIHILHDDDIIATGFYGTILELVARYPEAALYATGFGTLGEKSSEQQRNASRLFIGEAAARFLLEVGAHACGSVVLTRRAIERRGLFRKEFEYCPDEEAYLRYAAEGGFAFAPLPLYRVRAHDAQARYATWRRPDFVRTYLKSRVEGARNFSESAATVAAESSTRNVVTVALTLALRGERGLASQRLQELADAYPAAASSPRFRLAKLACRSRVLLHAAALRRRVVRARKSNRQRRA